MVETEEMFDLERANKLINDAATLATESGCTLVECVHAFKILAKGCAELIGGNAREILLEGDWLNDSVLDSKLRVVKGGDANEVLVVPEEDVLDRGRGD